MPDIRKHRGAHPEDRKLFGDDQLIALRTAVEELSWLLTRDYSMKSAVKLVGDRHALADRQRLAVSRAACSDQSKARRAGTRTEVEELQATDLIIDGFNLIITIEAALSGGVLFLGRDGCIRDLSSVHGSYRSVNETAGAIRLIGESLAALVQYTRRKERRVESRENHDHQSGTYDWNDGANSRCRQQRHQHGCRSKFRRHHFAREGTRCAT